MPMFEIDHGSVISNGDNNTVWTAVTFGLSTIGIGLSALALLLLISTAALFIEWRRSYKNQLLIQLMLARFFYTFVRYFNDIQVLFDAPSASDYVVTLDVLLFIYSEMALVTWMFIFSRQMYISLVKVFESDNTSIWKVSLCSWCIPGVLSFMLYLLYYARRETYSFRFVIYLMIVKWPVLIANAFLLITVLKSVLQNNTNTKNNAKIVVVMLVLIFGFCFQQMFTDIYKLIFLLKIDDLKFTKYILVTSNILSMYHCAFSILFWLFGNNNTRQLWKFKKKEQGPKSSLNVRFSS